MVNNEDYFYIDADAREIYMPDVFNGSLGVFGDHNTENIKFRMPRYFDGVDLSLFKDKTTTIVTEDVENKYTTINYINAKNQGFTHFCDVAVDTNDNNYIIITWTVSKAVAAAVGKVHFSLKIYSLKNNVITYAYNTKTCCMEITESVDFSTASTGVDEGDIALANLADAAASIIPNLEIIKETSANISEAAKMSAKAVGQYNAYESLVTNSVADWTRTTTNSLNEMTGKVNDCKNWATTASNWASTAEYWAGVSQEHATGDYVTNTTFSVTTANLAKLTSAFKEWEGITGGSLEKPDGILNYSTFVTNMNGALTTLNKNTLKKYTKYIEFKPSGQGTYTSTVNLSNLLSDYTETMHINAFINDCTKEYWLKVGSVAVQNAFTKNPNVVYIHPNSTSQFTVVVALEILYK